MSRIFTVQVGRRGNRGAAGKGTKAIEPKEEAGRGRNHLCNSYLCHKLSEHLLLVHLICGRQPLSLLSLIELRQLQERRADKKRRTGRRGRESKGDDVEQKMRSKQVGWPLKGPSLPVKKGNPSLLLKTESSLG